MTRENPLFYVCASETFGNAGKFTTHIAFVSRAFRNPLTAMMSMTMLARIIREIAAQTAVVTCWDDNHAELSVSCPPRGARCVSPHDSTRTVFESTHTHSGREHNREPLPLIVHNGALGRRLI